MISIWMIDGWNTSFLWDGLFFGATLVSGRECFFCFIHTVGGSEIRRSPPAMYKPCNGIHYISIGAGFLNHQQYGCWLLLRNFRYPGKRKHFWLENGGPGLS